MRRLTVLALAALATSAIAHNAIANTPAPNDPYFSSSGSWGQTYADQWSLARLGFAATASEPSAWNLPGASPQPVVVAVIDSGIDYSHADFPREHLWTNAKETLNGLDDDQNGYVDDVIGWNFVDGDNNPWDYAGHGTLVAGLIAAGTHNEIGVAGVNPDARVMALKVMNVVGGARSSHIAAALEYAQANGARVINLSLGGSELSGLVERSVRRALAAGIVIVVAAGNEGRDAAGFGLADVPGVITVAATDPADQRARFSNWGQAVTVAAPGVDLLGLRARGSDLMKFSGAASYRDLAAVVGKDGEYYRASGTSFAAALVSGVTSWLIARRPELNGGQVARIIAQSARDIGPAGVDPLTGYGLVDARAAFAADPEMRVESRITQVDLDARAEGTRIRVVGTADANAFAGARVRMAAEAWPNDWIEVAAPLAQPVRNGVLAEVDPKQLRGAQRWIVELVTRHQNGRERAARYIVDLGGAP